MAKFSPRMTRPEKGNKYYIRQVSGGWNGAVEGSPKDKYCNVLSNCVGYACGRFNEIIGSMKYPYLNCNAENFIERAKQYGLQVSSKPVLGGIMVWQKGATLSGNDGAGHVAIVEKIIDNNTIYTSESGYGSSAFWNSTRNNSNGRWGIGSGYKFRGCIINPSIKDNIPSEPKPDILLMVKKTIRGDYGNGNKRKKKLGKYYNEVQHQVNLNYKNGTTRWDNVKLY